MIYRAARLFELTSQHDYFGGAGGDYLAWEPTTQCVGTLARHRLLFRALPNGAVVLYEVDTSQAGSHTMIPLDAEVELVFVARVRDKALAGYTDLPFRGGHVFVFSNRSGHIADGVPLLHAASEAGLSEQARLTPTRVTLRYATAAVRPRLTVADAANHLVVDVQISSRDGAVEHFVDLSSSGPGLFSVALDGARQEWIYADAQLWGNPPFAVAVLTARDGVPAGFEFVAQDDQPVTPHRAFRVAFASRTTVWRYVVVPRSDSGLDGTSLRMQDAATSGDGRPFTFNAAGSVPTTGEEQGFVFESASPISFRSTPYQGLRLQKKKSEPPQPFIDVISDLPNPQPGALGPTSTASRPVSELFVYV